MKKQKHNLVIECAKMWPREVFDIKNGKDLLINKQKILNKSGVYVLYQGNQPYYIGKATKSLYKRLHDHANKTTDRYFNLWNYFSAFVVDGKNIDAIEGLLIAAIPTANGAIPKIQAIPMSKTIREKLRQARQNQFDN